jgi:hypothetical protein
LPLFFVHGWMHESWCSGYGTSHCII